MSPTQHSQTKKDNPMAVKNMYGKVEAREATTGFVSVLAGETYARMAGFMTQDKVAIRPDIPGVSYELRKAAGLKGLWFWERVG